MYETVSLDGEEYKLSALQLIGDGGEGKVYKLDASWALKLYNEDQPKNARQLELLTSQRLYAGLAEFAAIPAILVKTGEGKTIGYVMRLLEGYQPFSVLSSRKFCEQNSLTISWIAWLFWYLHRAISTAHQLGFVIGDLRGDNVVYKIKTGGARIQENPVRLLDVDSWGIKTGAVNFPCSAIDLNIAHPTIIRAKETGQHFLASVVQYHDWYAFALLFAKCLIKCDPFHKGLYRLGNSKTRKLSGITCWHQAVEKTPAENAQLFRFNQALISEFESWLSGYRNTGEFSLAAIENLIKTGGETY